MVRVGQSDHQDADRPYREDGARSSDRGPSRGRFACGGGRSGKPQGGNGVTTVSMTLLIDRRRVIRQRWDRFASAAELDVAIAPLVGRSVLDQPR
jgi:hypothetical protein